MMTRLLSTVAVAGMLIAVPPAMAQYGSTGPVSGSGGGPASEARTGTAWGTGPGPGREALQQPGAAAQPGVGADIGTMTGPGMPRQQQPGMAQPRMQDRSAYDPGMQQGRVGSQAERSPGEYSADLSPMRLSELPPNMQGYVRSRMGPHQRVNELVETTILNQLAATGQFQQLNSLRRSGDTFIAEVTTQSGEQVTVQYDPASGQLSQLQ